MALLVTFSCYGSHLPGDDRGSFDHLRRGERRFILPNAALEDDCRRRMRQPPCVLATSAARATERDAIAGVCKHRAWFLYALHVRANHVHGVVESDAPRRVLNDWKAYATRSLRKAGLAGADQAVWTHGGSTRLIASAEGLRLIPRPDGRGWRAGLAGGAGGRGWRSEFGDLKHSFLARLVLRPIHFTGARRRSSSNQFSTTVTRSGGAAAEPAVLIIRKRLLSGETS